MKQNTIEYGYCHCGCGRLTTISNRNDKSHGQKIGEPRNFIKGHQGRKRGWAYSSEGAIFLHENGTQILEHRKIIENILGRKLSAKNVIHHIDRNPANNSKNNLVVCEDSAYHRFIHARQKAFESCGHANWRPCAYCKKYDDPKNMFSYIGDKRISRTAHHRKCHNEHMVKWNVARKNKKYI